MADELMDAPNQQAVRPDGDMVVNTEGEKEKPKNGRRKKAAEEEDAEE